MLKDRILEIVKTLTHLTDSGVINWIEDSSNPDTRSYRRKMIATGEDSTIYETEIKFSLSDEEWKLDEDGLWLRNKSLPNGIFYVTDRKSDGEVSKLRDTILKKCCSDMKPSISDVEVILGNIARGINLASFREGKLNKILK
jgi:hypothetical protein